MGTNLPVRKIIWILKLYRTKMQRSCLRPFLMDFFFQADVAGSYMFTSDFINAQMHSPTFSREATIPRLDLSNFSICTLGYSQNRLISFDCRQNENVSLQFLIRWSKLNHIPHVKWFEIPVYKLAADFFRGFSFLLL